MKILTKVSTIVAAVLLVASLPASAQLHYKGHHGIQAEYGLRSQFSEFYSLGYQFFLNNRFQLEFATGYERGNYRRSEAVSQYDAFALYDVENYYLHQTINYSFLRVFKRLYFNVGAGLTQTYQQAETTSFVYTTDSMRLAELDEPQEFDPNSVSLDSKIRFGGHANILAELYLNRYFTLLARHRLIYTVNGLYDSWDQQTSVGLRVNF